MFYDDMKINKYIKSAFLGWLQQIMRTETTVLSDQFQIMLRGDIDRVV